MRKATLSVAVLGAMFVPLLDAAPVQAQATRTWVSGVGDDVNPCSRTAPCKTYAGAISKTATNGEINCLDPGGFGALTITKSISVVCDYTEGGVLAAGSNGFIINIGVAGSIVTLKGQDVECVGTGLNGIRVLGVGTVVHIHKVQIRNCRGSATGSGIDIRPTGGTTEVYIADSYITDNGTTSTTGGILIRPTGSASTNVSINNVQLENNSSGIRLDGAGSTGPSNLSVRNSVVAGSTNNGITVTTTLGALAALVNNTAVLFNAGTGVNVNGAAATGRIGSSTITGNVTGVSATASGNLRTFSTNQIRGNLADGTPIANVDGLN